MFFKEKYFIISRWKQEIRNSIKFRVMPFQKIISRAMIRLEIMFGLFIFHAQNK